MRFQILAVAFSCFCAKSPSLVGTEVVLLQAGARAPPARTVFGRTCTHKMISPSISTRE